MVSRIIDVCVNSASSGRRIVGWFVTRTPRPLDDQHRWMYYFLGIGLNSPSFYNDTYIKATSKFEIDTQERGDYR